MKWFDRAFAFDQPERLFPNILERLRGTPARLEERLAGLTASELVDRGPDDRWSIQENVGHLLDLEPLWAGRVEDLVEGKPELRPADLTNRRTHEARHNEKPIGDIVAAFRTARGELVEALEAVGPGLWSRTALHARLRQPMRLVDHVLFVAEHDDHHLARISESLRLARAPTLGKGGRS